MAAPTLTYATYSSADGYRGKLGEDAFLAALPSASARLSAVTGDDVPEVWQDRWLMALCAMVDHVAGADGSHDGLKSQTIGGTSKTWTDESAAGTDADAVAPWLVGTGLLYCGLCGRS